jgi:predicted Zn-dependent peptidase
MTKPAASDPLAILDQRPEAGPPREYRFPRFDRTKLANGLTLIGAHVPGRPLLLANLLVHAPDDGGATSEPAAQGGVTVLAARAMTEGTAQRDAVALIEASERLGAEIHAEAGWDSLGVSVEVARSRLEPALALLAEVALEPSFPESEVERLRAERVNDLMQAKADPRRRVERVFGETIYASDAPYRRPLAGTEDTVPGLDREVVAARHGGLLRPGSATLVVAGDLDEIDLPAVVGSAFGGWAVGEAARVGTPPANAPHPRGRRVVVVDRPGSPQTEVRIGHVGIPRKTPDYHAISVLNAIVGGLFGSRLNRLLREEKGYTYGVHSGFEMRRGPGPFAVRTAVHTEVTVPAINDLVSELDRMRQAPVEPDELTVARDYLVGVFPLRFETAAQVAGAIAGLVTQDLPDDELDRYRPAIAEVSAAQVLTAAQAHIRVEEASIVVVGDARAFEGDLRDAGLGEVEFVRDNGE